MKLARAERKQRQANDVSCFIPTRHAAGQKQRATFGTRLLTLGEILMSSVTRSEPNQFRRVHLRLFG